MSEKSNAVAELKAIDEAVSLARDLASLRPFFYRLEEIARENADSVEVQVAVGDIKQRILNRGNELKAPGAKVGAPDGYPTGDRTVVIPIPGMTSPQDRSDPYNPPLFPVEPWPDAGSAEPPPGQVPGQGMDPPPRRQVGVAIGAIAVLAAIVIFAVVLRNDIAAKIVGIAMQITTEPPGAAIQINGEAKCVSECSLSLPAGIYQIAATLNGYEPGSGQMSLVAGQHGAALNLMLQPQPQTVRIHSDLARGTVVLDDMLPVALENHEHTFENVKPSRHTVKVMGPGGETSFGFDLAPAKMPEVMGTVAARDVLTVLVASFASRARVVTSSGPWKLTVNGHPQSDAGPAGVDLDSFDPGENELVTGEGSDRRSLKEHFPAAPMLTVFVTPDPNTGSLTISTGESDVRVFLNDKEYPARTRQGVLRIQLAGPVEVRVSKDGFQSPAPQVANVKKGSAARLEFKLTASPAR